MLSLFSTARAGQAALHRPFRGWLLLLFLLGMAGWAQAQVTANFSGSPTGGCAPVVVQFTDLSTGSPNFWQWDFGNGNSSTLQNPSTTYLNPGSYTVTLITGNGSSRDTLILTNFITVFSPPNPDFNFGPPQGCQPHEVVFTDNSTPGNNPIVSWLWDFGDGNTSSNQNPVHIYTTAGTFSVSLQVTDAAGCSGTFQIPGAVTVFPKPNALFTGSPTSSCVAPLTVQFTDGSTNANSWSWDFGDGNFSSQQNPSHTYVTPGIYTVTLLVSTANGCRDTLVMPNYIANGANNAQIAASDSAICPGDVIQLFNQSTPSGISVRWEIPGIDTFNTQNPMVTFPDPGSYDVLFYINYGSGCFDTLYLPNWIFVDSFPDSSFQVIPNLSCVLPFTANFNSPNAPNVTYTWDFGDGTTGTGPNPSHTYTNYGAYDIIMSAVNTTGCFNADTLLSYVIINPLEVNIQADTVLGCIPLTVTFSPNIFFSPSSLTSYQWDLGNGVTSTQSNPTTTYTTPGAYTVTLITTNQNGCVDTTIQTNMIQAGIQPTANFSINPNPACGNVFVQFADSSINATSWYWSFGDGNYAYSQNTTHQYPDTGMFTVTLIVDNFGCTDTLVDSVYIMPPIAVFDWDPTPVCDPFDTVLFFSNSIGADSLAWNFGAFGNSSLQNPPIYFGTTGLFPVTLIAYNFTTGCTDTAYSLVQVTNPHIGFFTLDTAGCAPLTVQFTDTSTGPTNIWEWNFGDGSTNSFSQNPVHVYSSPGIYSVTLNASTIWGCEMEATYSAYIVVGGVSQFLIANPNPVCLTDTMQFTSTSTSPVGMSTWSWAFGDGGTSNLQSPAHAYNNPGNYSVAVTETDALGCSATDTLVVQVGSGFFSIQVDSVYCIGDTTAFFNFSSPNATFNWDFGDGTSSTAYSPHHYYPNLGTYPMVFTGFDPIGCTDTIAQNIHIVDPFPDFSANPTVGSCPPLLVQFTNLSSWDIVGWEWDFGDGGTSTVANPAHNYLFPGNYTVRLIVTSAGGCKDTVEYNQLIQVSGPTASFTLSPPDGCDPTEVLFQGTGVNVNQWQWDFGDGNVQLGGSTISHNYSSPGTYTPVLIVEDTLGCAVAYPGDTVSIYPTPQVAFSAPDTHYCGLNTVIAFNNLTVPSGVVTTWEWDFGDGNTSNQANPQHQYTGYGSYTVTLIGTTAFGCTDTMVLPNYILLTQPPIAAYTDSTGPGPGPKPYYFTDSSLFYQPAQSWQWQIGGFNFSGPNAVHTFSTCGQYPITLVVTDVLGCADTANGLLSPYPYPVVDAGPNASFCAGTGGAQLNAVVTGTSTPPYYYQWWCDTTLINCGLDSIFDNDPNALPPNSTMYYVQVTDNIGCQSPVDSVWVEVLPLPIANAGADAYICPDSAPGVILNGTVSGAPGPYQYQWSPATGLNNPNLASPYARPDTTTIYTLTVLSSNGCASLTTTVDTVSTVTVHVNPQPIAQAGPDRDLCLGEGLQLQGFGSGAGPNYSFEWSPYTGLSDSSIANPNASPNATTDYILTVWSNGCPGSDTVTVRVHTLPTATAGPNTDICLGDSAQLTASGSGDPFATVYSFQWSPSAGLSNPNAAQPLASPMGTTAYTVIASTEFGCEGPPDTVIVAIRPTPIAEAGPQQTLCAGDSVQLQGSYYYLGPDTANPSMVYFGWWPSTGLLSDSTQQSPWINPTQTGFYYLGVRHNTCFTLDSVLVTVNPDLGAMAGTDTNRICQGDSVQLWASGGIGGVNIEWIPAAGLADPFSLTTSASPSISQTYLAILQEGGCTDTAAVRIEVIPSPAASLLNSSPEGCAPLTVVFMDNGTQTQARIWDFGDGSPVSNSANPTHTYTQPGDYVVTFTGTNTAGCRGTDNSLVVHVADPGQAAFTSTPSVPAELVAPDAMVQFMDLSRGAVRWHWQFGDGGESAEQHPLHAYQQLGEFHAQLTITTAEGCVSTADMGPYRIIAPDLFIPNVFTPNDDGLVDGFRAEYSGHETYTLAIYDRWGALLFTTRNPQEFWKGTTVKGENAPEGVYYYQITVGKKDYAGWVTLVR